MKRVVVNDPFQVVHDGAIYRPGCVAEVPDHVANLWVFENWVRVLPDSPEKRKAREPRGRAV